MPPPGENLDSLSLFFQAGQVQHGLQDKSAEGFLWMAIQLSCDTQASIPKAGLHGKPRHVHSLELPQV